MKEYILNYNNKRMSFEYYDVDEKILIMKNYKNQFYSLLTNINE